MLRSGLPLLFSLPQLVRCSNPHPCPLSHALSNFAATGGKGSGKYSAALVPAQTNPPSGKPPLSPLGRPGPKERPIQVFPRPAGCSRAPVNATGLRGSYSTRPRRPRNPRLLHPLAGRKEMEAWRRRTEGHGRCRFVRSSPRGVTRGARGAEALVLVLDEDTGLVARRGQPLRAQLRGQRWM